MSPAVTSTRLPSLTGLRFVAAFGVFLCHVAVFVVAQTGEWRQLMILGLLGPVGVSLFFVLSGFVLTLSVRGTDTARGFWRRRIVKIYPSHLVVWVLLMVLAHGIGMPRPSVGAVTAPTLPGDVANAFLVQGLVPLPGIGLAGNGVAWSLTCELVFYLLFPWLLPRVKRIPERRLLVAAGITVAAAWSVPLLLTAVNGTLFGQGPPGGQISEQQLMFVYLFPLSRLPEFVLGMILARMHTGGRPVRVRAVASAALLCVTLLVGAATLPTPFLMAATTVVPVALLIRATAALDVHARRSLLRTPGMVFLGDISYAFYLVHATLIAAVLYYIGGGWGPAPVAAVSFAAALGVAWLLYTHVEQPCMRRFAAGRPRP